MSKRKKPSLAPLGESEMELLQLVWEAGPSSVSEIHERVLLERKVAYTTVMSQLRKLADKGFLEFEKEGNAYIYCAARRPQEVRHSVLSSILDKVFKGSALELVESLVKNESLTSDDYAELRRLIDDMEKKQAQTGE